MFVAPHYWDFDKNQPTLDCPNREYLEKLIADKLSERKGKLWNRNPRMVFNQAIERGYAKMEQYLLKSYKVGTLHAETPKRAISKAEVIAVMDYRVKDGIYTPGFPYLRADRRKQD